MTGVLVPGTFMVLSGVIHLQVLTAYLFVVGKEVDYCFSTFCILLAEFCCVVRVTCSVMHVACCVVHVTCPLRNVYMSSLCCNSSL